MCVHADLCGYLRAFPHDAGRDGPFLQLMGTGDGGAFAVLPHLLTSKVGAVLCAPLTLGNPALGAGRGLNNP